MLALRQRAATAFKLFSFYLQRRNFCLNVIKDKKSSVQERNIVPKHRSFSNKVSARQLRPLSGCTSIAYCVGVAPTDVMGLICSQHLHYV